MFCSIYQYKHKKLFSNTQIYSFRKVDLIMKKKVKKGRSKQKLKAYSECYE